MADEVYDGAIGIDLGMRLTQSKNLLGSFADCPTGTTYSCVANYEGSNVEISTFNGDLQSREST